MRKTKIVCTLGPTTDNEKILEKMMLAGMNVARINFSHGNYTDQQDRIEMFKKVRDKLKLPIPLLLDTKGPEIRIGKFEDKKVTLYEGDTFTLLNEDVIGDSTKVSITYKDLYKEIPVGTVILINDGTIEVKVKEIIEKDIVCEVIHGGDLTNTKSINIPGMKLSLPGLTEKDIQDIKYGIEVGFDYIAASFIRTPEDVLAIRKVLKDNNGEHIKIISKIENREGVNNFDEIMQVSDGIMVARGDLGVEIPMEEIPIYQKQFIKKSALTGKIVIIATQMLESMILNPRPTRAEVSDVANAIFDGTSAIMLSGETATGKYPVECVKTMNDIAVTTENSIKYWKKFKSRQYDIQNLDYGCNVSYAVCTTAMNIDAKAILAYTNTGNTVKKLTGFMPQCPIFAITQNEIMYRQLGLYWNVVPKLFAPQESIDKLLHEGINELKQEKFLTRDDKIVVAGGKKALADLEEDETQINNVIGGIVKI